MHDLRFIDGGASTGGISPGDAEAPTEEAPTEAPTDEAPTEAPTTEAPKDSPTDLPAESSAPTDSPAESSAARFPCAEVLDPMPSLSATCDPACALASPRLSSALTSRVRTPAGTIPNDDSLFSPTRTFQTFQAAVDRARWGREWPVSGARVDEKASRWASRRERLRHVLAIPSGGSGGNVRVFSDGDPSPGKLTELASIPPGPNAGTTVADRAVTRCHVALGGCVLVIGRACGAVEVHAVDVHAVGARSRQLGESPGPRTIRQLDSGLDLASAGKGGGGTGHELGGGYELVAELGSHAAPITSIVTDANCALLAVGDAHGVVTLVDLYAGLMMTSVKVFVRDGEGVGCMELCPRIVGTGTGSGTVTGGGGDAEVAGSNPDAAGVPSDAAGDAYGRNGRNDDAPPALDRFSGADVLCVASTESAVAFLDVALPLTGGTRGKNQLTPKTASRALAVAPLTMHGTPPRSMVRGRGADGALRTLSPHNPYSSLWFNVKVGTQSSMTEDEPARTRSTGGRDEIDRRTADEATAFVAVASEEAIRVYPAHGALRGERHTVKKASTAEEPLVAAALVAPVAPDDDDDDDDRYDRYDRHDRYDPNPNPNPNPKPAAFAAVSSRGRLLVWSLPGLAPLRSLGPVPCLSVADGVGFCVDGVLFASAGGGAGAGSVAKLALAPPKGIGGAKGYSAESGLALVDVELAAAAEAAESAQRFDTQRHQKAPPGGGHPPASVQSPFSPEGTPEKEKATGPKPKNAASARSDLTKSMNR